MAVSDSLREKIALLKKWDDSYYNKSISLVTDQKYDLLKDYVMRSLPADSLEYQMLQSKVGHVASSGWKKETHSIVMGSQNKLSSEDEIKQWWDKTLRENSIIVDTESILQHKIDGFSLELKYKRGKLIAGVTRGDGIIGENITQNVRLFRHVPNVLPIQKDMTVRGEAFLTKKDFLTIQKETNNHYENERNAASGISRRFDGRFCEYIKLYAFDISANVRKEEDKIIVLKKLGFETVMSHKCKDIDDVLCLYNEYKDSIRDTLGYGIDGLVFKFNSISIQNHLGLDKNRPLGQIALKFDSDQAITRVDRIDGQVGRTGRITPVAYLIPVKLMGSTVKKATLHNYGMINHLMVTPGAEVVIEKKGDIIPQIVDVMSPGEVFTQPDLCPSCGGPVKWDGVNLWCHNSECPEREINRITYWLTSLGVKGFSSSFIKKLWDKKLIRKTSDLYKLDIEDFGDIEGVGEKTVKKFIKSLKDSSSMLLEKFIVSLGIPTVSNSTADVLVQNFETWDKIRSLSSDEISKLPGFAKISSESVVNGINNILDMADELLEVINIKEKKKTKLTGKSFCVTGSLNKMSRKEFELFVSEEGGYFKSGVSKGLDYLVTNNPDSGSGKSAKARKINENLKDSPENQIKIITEDEFFEIAGGVPDKMEDKKDKEDSPEEDGPHLEFNPLF